MVLKMSKYNHGVVYIYRENIQRNVFNAKQNANDLSNMTLLYKFNFEQLSKRVQDLEFADSLGFSLSIKVRVPYFANGEITNAYKAVIGNKLYDISYVDSDRYNNFLYLEEVKTIDS